MQCHIWRCLDKHLNIFKKEIAAGFAAALARRNNMDIVSLKQASDRNNIIYVSAIKKFQDYFTDEKLAN